MTVATPADVAGWMGWDVNDPALAPVQRWLDALENLIRVRVPDFDSRLTDPGYTARLRDIECTAVERKLRNPDGFASESVDNVALSYKSNAASGVLELTQGEWTDVGIVSGIGSVRITPGAPPFPPPREWWDWGAYWPPDRGPLWLS